MNGQHTIWVKLSYTIAAQEKHTFSLIPKALITLDILTHNIALKDILIIFCYRTLGVPG